MIQIGIIENNRGLRYNLQQFFNKQEGMCCTIATDSVDTFLCKASPKDKLHVVLQALNAKGQASYKSISRVKKTWPTTEVITFNGQDDRDSIFKALYAGATGYLTKGTSLNKIKEAILETYQGCSALSPSVARKLVDHFKPKRNNKLLTPKEQQIVHCLTDGLSYKMTADKVSISINTLNFHIKNIYRKLGVNSKAEVVAMRLRGEC